MLTVFAGILHVSNKPEMRYYRQYSSIYDAIHKHKGPVDIAVGGSSRVRRGVYVPYLAESLRPYFAGKKPVIYNLGVAGNGTDAQLMVLLELLEKRAVKTIFFQVCEVRQNKPPTHRNLRKIGRMEDLLFTPVKMPPHELFTHRVQMLYERTSETLDNCLTDIENCFSQTPAVAAQDLAGGLLPEEEAADEAMVDNKPRPVDVVRQLKFLKEREEKNRDYFASKPRRWNFDKGYNHRTGYYLDLLIRRAAEKGTTVVLMDFPKFQWDQVDPRFPEQVRERFGVEYLYMDREQLRQIGEGGGFGDYGHVNLRGEPAIRNMIVEYFKNKSDRQVQ